MAAAHTGIVAVRSDRLDRWVQLGIASGQVINVDFPADRPADAGEDHPLVDRLAAYLDAEEPDDFQDVEVALTVPTAHRRVYETLREVGYGRDITLSDLADASPLDADDDEATATVREALGANPIPIVVPDHRVSGAAGATPPDVRDTLRHLEELD